MDPLQNRTFCPAITRFHLCFTQVWLNYACPCLPISGMGRYAYVEHSQKMVSSHIGSLLQVSNAGRKCLKISRIFKFDVPLWMIRIRSDLYLHRNVSLSCRNRFWRFQPCIYNWFGDLAVWWTPFRIGHLPSNYQISSIFHPIVWPTSVAKLCMSMHSQLQEGYVRVRRACTENISLQP